MYPQSITPTTHPPAAEEWRQVPLADFADAYSVSNLGRVRRDAPSPRSRPGDILKPRDHGHGSINVSLCFQGHRRDFSIRHLVALTFPEYQCSRPPTKTELLAFRRALAYLEYLTGCYG